MLKGLKIGVIGGGNMGSILIGGLVTHGLSDANDITVSDIIEEKRAHLTHTWKVHTTVDNLEAVLKKNIVILAVKPQNMNAVLKQVSSAIDQSSLIISIAAGIPTRRIEGYFKSAAKVVRVMPNTPALIGEGASALACGHHATAEDMQLAFELFDAVGLTVEVDEDLMDAVTAISGSGPAYGFLFIESMVDAAAALGLGRDVALTLASQTLLGAARMCLKKEKTPAELRDMVTSLEAPPLRR